MPRLPLNQDQIEALRDYATKNGREWKSKLNHDWMTGKCYGTLQQIRNQFGPTWLVRFRFRKGGAK